jgi:hypothetical protein
MLISSIGRGGAARELGELEEVDLEELADLLEPLQREGALREQALDARLAQAKARRERAIGDPARLQQLLQGLHQAGGLRVVPMVPFWTRGIDFRYY